MILPAVILACTLIVSCLIVVLAFRSPPKPAAKPDWLATRSGRSLIVHTLDGQSIAGVLIHQGTDGLMLMAAKLIDAGAVLPGETWIPAHTVAFIQVPTEVSATGETGAG